MVNFKLFCSSDKFSEEKFSRLRRCIRFFSSFDTEVRYGNVVKINFRNQASSSRVGKVEEKEGQESGNCQNQALHFP